LNYETPAGPKFKRSFLRVLVSAHLVLAGPTGYYRECKTWPAVPVAKGEGPNNGMGFLDMLAEKGNCWTCNGSGKIRKNDQRYGGYLIDCPSCGGSGNYNPPDPLMERLYYLLLPTAGANDTRFINTDPELLYRLSLEEEDWQCIRDRMNQIAISQFTKTFPALSEPEKQRVMLALFDRLVQERYWPWLD
jgi:hypothetical protein